MARTKAPTSFRFQAAALILAVVIGAVLYGIEMRGGNSGSGADPSPLAVHATGKMVNFVPAREPLEMKPVSFRDGEGNEMSLADFEGKVALVNLWATWCAPCKEEMPALDDLQGKLGGEDFAVVAISLDRGDIALPREFFGEIGVEHLDLYHDQTGRTGPTLAAHGLPTTVLIGPDGRSLGRLVGPAEWASPDAVALIEAAIAATKPAAQGS